MKFLVPRNWADFQHYKDRSPVWIKLHRKILDDRDFHRLHVASRALAPMLWLIASEYEDGKIPLDHDLIAFRLRLDEAAVQEAITPLIQKGFFSVVDEPEPPASSPLAERLPREEKRREEKRQRRDREETEKTAHSAPRFDPLTACPSNVNPEIWADWCVHRREKRKPLTEKQCRLIAEDLAGHPAPNDVIRNSIRNGWQGLFPEKTTAAKTQGRHTGFENRDYSAGVPADGKF